ncbi:unnamed protein product [Prunus brigantina]
MTKIDLWLRSFLQTTRFRHFCFTSVLVCTSTLAWGVNLLGHHLFIIKVRQNLCGIFFIWFLYLQRFLAGVYCSNCFSGQIYVSVDSLAGNRIL